MRENKQLNASVNKAFSILDCFTIDKPEWGVRELAGYLGVNKSTMYRQLASMASIGVLQRMEEKGPYRLGIKLFELGNRVDINQALAHISHPILENVASNITETVHLGILSNQNVLMVDKVESSQGLKLRSIIGTSSPLHCTGIGKTLLAHQDQERIAQIFQNISLDKFTEYTITNHQELACELSAIKTNGYAMDRQEFEIGLLCVAVPVFNQNGDCVAALSAAGPTSRFREEALHDYVLILQNGACEIQERIGNYKI